jgi:DNA-binding NarL/FixJ family response regulator
MDVEIRLDGASSYGGDRMTTSEQESTAEGIRPSEAAETRDSHTPRRGPVCALIVDDDRDAAHMLCRALEAGGARAKVATGADGLARARELVPDIAFVAMAAPSVAGAAIVRSIAAMDLGIRQIVLAQESDPDDAVAAIRDGARGYLGKRDVLTCSLPRLIDAAMADELVCSRPLLMSIVDRLARSPEVAARPGQRRLTARESEVLGRLAAGRSTHWIADDLVISVETVRTHIKNLMRKLAVRSRAELLGAAARMRTETPEREAGRDEKRAG